MTRINPPLFLCLIMLTWAVLSVCTAFAKNFTGLLLVRFFLGVVEAPYYPGALLIISNFYTRTEVATRIAILYTGNILATAFAGLIAAGVFQLDGRMGYAGWQWLFIIQGSFYKVMKPQSRCRWTVLTVFRSCDRSGGNLCLPFLAFDSTHDPMAQRRRTTVSPFSSLPRCRRYQRSWIDLAGIQAGCQ